MIRATLVFAAAVLLGGCGWFSKPEPVERPVELVDFQAELDVRSAWSHRIGEGAGGQYLRLPVHYADGRVFAAERGGRIAAFDAESGERLWERRTGITLTSGPGGGGGLVLAGGLTGEVLALDAASGEPAWHARATSEVLAPPTRADGVVLVRSIDGRLTGLHAADGRRLWVYDRSVPVLTLRGTSAPVTVAGSTIAGFDGGRLAALAIDDGRLLWDVAIAVPRGRSELERMVDIDATPVIGGADIVYAAAYQGRLAAVAAATGRVVWTRDIPSHAGMALHGGVLYVTDDRSHVWALDARSGATLWRQEGLQGRAVTGPAAYGEYVVVADFEGYVHWLAADDGRFLARTRADRKGVLAQPVAVDTTVYVSGAGGTVAALRARAR